MHISQVINPPFVSAYFKDRLQIISGGQNGADQAGLRAARTCKVQTGGTAPLGWITLDGPRPGLKSFGLVEASKAGYPYRTELNVAGADVTLRFATSFSSPGERCTYKAIIKHKKPYVDFNVPTDLTVENAAKLGEHLIHSGYYIINVAGNSEKTSPGIGDQVEEFLILVIEYINLAN